MATNDLYQSTFMPVFQKAETKIKTLVLLAFLYHLSLTELRLKINGIVAWVETKIPKELRDKTAYLRGLKRTSEEFILLYYKKPYKQFVKAKTALYDTLPTDRKIKTPSIETPKQMLEFVSKPQNMWAEAKGSPNVVNYDKEVKKMVSRLCEEPVVTDEEGKKPISLWQKAELDVRHEAQMQMLDDLRTKGIRYAYTSTHPNCSKRCQAWQGKLFDLNEHAKGSNHQVTTLNGTPVYSLLDVIEKEDKYGYKNNIIVGFNCRHRLVPYEIGRNAPEQYTDKDVKKQREIEGKIRQMERNIRSQKTRSMCYEITGEKKLAKDIKNSVKILVEQYKAYCNANGYAWHQYRINI